MFFVSSKRGGYVLGLGVVKNVIAGWKVIASRTEEGSTFFS